MLDLKTRTRKVAKFFKNNGKVSSISLFPRSKTSNAPQLAKDFGILFVNKFPFRSRVLKLQFKGNCNFTKMVDFVVLNMRLSFIWSNKDCWSLRQRPDTACIFTHKMEMIKKSHERSGVSIFEAIGDTLYPICFPIIVYTSKRLGVVHTAIVIGLLK